MLRCDEVARLCASDEIHASPLTKRLAVRMHLLLCRHCRRYVRELKEIAEVARGLGRTEPDSDARNEAIVRNVLGDPDDSPR